MRILVLGGTAFLSSEIVRRALAAGHDVTCVARGSAGVPPGGATWVQADRSQGQAAYAAVAPRKTGPGGWDAVIDVTRDPDQGREALEVLAPTARHWTAVSSCSVYADHSVAGAGEDAPVLPPLAPGTALTPENYGEAKSALEQWAAGLAPDKVHLCRAGLIGGPGDGSDRYGYWPARFARDDDPALVPDIPGDSTQVIDVRDLAAWIVAAAETGVVGALNAVGDAVPFAAYLDECLRLTGRTAEVTAAPGDWLAGQGVNYWAGPDSLPLWLPPGHEGFAARSNAAALAAGLRLRPWTQTLRDTLGDERRRGLARDRKAGLSPQKERSVLAAYRARSD